MIFRFYDMIHFNHSRVQFHNILVFILLTLKVMGNKIKNAMNEKFALICLLCNLIYLSSRLSDLEEISRREWKSYILLF